MAEFTPAAYMFYNGKKFICPCGCGDFKIEEGTEPLRFWCDCGTHYTEDIVNTLNQEKQETAQSGE